jgi:arylsulfatase
MPREEVYARQIATASSRDTKLSPRPPWVKAWTSLPADAKKLYATQMEVYAAFLEQTDHHIGRIDYLASVASRQQPVMLASDNGASAEGGSTAVQRMPVSESHESNVADN